MKTILSFEKFTKSSLSDPKAAMKGQGKSAKDSEKKIDQSHNLSLGNLKINQPDYTKSSDLKESYETYRPKGPQNDAFHILLKKYGEDKIQKIQNAWGKNYDAISQYYNELNKKNRGSTNVAQELADFIDKIIKGIDENSAQTTATINSISKTSELRKRLADAKTDSEKISILTQIRDIEAAEEKAAKLKNPS
jgi:hypothetical protein